ncbi:PREDICTED: histone H2A type 4-like [Galeopterus variegatus]|uniref:Histone H2A n=1 Tax=Galeopterus variegatus TaxID=482537 RepID=A0ABM0SFG3_GALVR|nr:PREDICTED: histone H2A type 4-like [Galeopterus variegatus]
MGLPCCRAPSARWWVQHPRPSAKAPARALRGVKRRLAVPCRHSPQAPPVTPAAASRVTRGSRPPSGRAAGAGARQKQDAHQPRHLQLAVRSDEELNKLLGRMTVAQGGVLPNIQAVLLPKKTESHQKAKGKCGRPPPGARRGHKCSFQSQPNREKGC